MSYYFTKQQLPLDDLRKLGLYDGSQINLTPDNLQALLAGQRTGLVTLHNLKADGFRIADLDARLSLSRQPDGTLALNLHPIYREAQQHGQLLNIEAELLKSGGLLSVTKTVQTGNGQPKTTVIEYDAETKEFVSYDPGRITAPEQVNGEQLSPEQQRMYRRGETVSLSDGTQFQYRAVEPKGITSNRNMLILSVLLDGGISYLLYTGLKNLFGSRTKQLDAHTEGFAQANEALQQQEKEKLQQQQQEKSANTPRR